MPLYLGESDGGRILLYGVGLTQVGDAFQPTIETWALIPSGEMGDNVFRSLGLSFSYTNGYALQITPIVDGVAGSPSTFSGSGSSEEGQAQVYLKARGTSIAARITCLSRSGDLTFRNLQVSFQPLRMWP